jgi:hypothetical protein
MKNLFYCFSILIAFASCTKVIDVDLNDADPKFVVEANYTAEDSTVRVKLTLTTSYFDNEPSTSLNNLVVIITDHLGNPQTVPFIGNGYYELTNYIPIFNTDYTMTVQYDGKTYTAVSRMNPPVPLEPITYEYYPAFFGLEAGYITYLRYNDPPGVENQFIVVMSLNYEEEGNLTDFYLQSDDFSDGNFVNRPLFRTEAFQIGDTIGLEMRSMDKTVYNYFSEVLSIAGGQSSAAPANPKTNWDNKGLGYFSAYSNSRREVIIE